MNALVAWAATCFLNALWQVALVFCTAWLAARLARRAGPATEQRIWITAVVLESFLPFCHLHPNLRFNRLLLLLRGTTGGAAEVHIQTEAIALPAQSWLPNWAQLFLALILLLAAGWAALRLARNLRVIYRLLAGARIVASAGAIGHLLTHFAVRLGLPLDSIRLRIVDRLHSPATVGFRTHSILLPTDLLPEQDSDGPLAQTDRDELAAALAHELVHIRRRDFVWNLLYELLALAVAWHPLSHLTRTQLGEARELVVDAEAACLLKGQRIYARSLVRLAARIAARPLSQPLPAVGLYGSNLFERRIAYLMQNAPQSSLLRRSLLLAGSAAILLATCYTAMALQTDVQPSNQSAPKHITISPGIAAGNLHSKVSPQYPPEAKQAGIQGTVVLSAVISKTGYVEALHVISGPPELTASALDAVRQWVYKPYLLNGNPVEVETRINVIYLLGNKPPAGPAEPPYPPEAKATAPSSETPPVTVSMPEAVYPPEAKDKHLDGIVVVKAAIDAAGHPTVLGASGPEIFQQPAREAVEKASFKPATRDGHPVETTVNIEVNFKHY